MDDVQNSFLTSDPGGARRGVEKVRPVNRMKPRREESSPNVGKTGRNVEEAGRVRKSGVG